MASMKRTLLRGMIKKELKRRGYTKVSKLVSQAFRNYRGTEFVPIGTGAMKTRRRVERKIVIPEGANV